MNWIYIIIPVVSAFLGWLANRITFRMFFYQKEPVKISGIAFQGIFTKRRQLEMKLNELVSDYLFLFSQIEQKLSDPTSVKKLLPLLETHIDTFLREKLPVAIPMLGMLIGDKTIGQVKSIFMKELQEMFPVLMKQYMIILQNDPDWKEIVMEKMEHFSPDKFKNILYEIMSAKFKSAEITGAALGFIIGLIQVLIIVLTL